MRKDLVPAAETIRKLVSAYEAGKALGLNPDRYGRCECQKSGGRRDSMRLWKDDRGWYCYRCRTGGDVIRLVETVRQCAFPDAVAWLDGAFHLGLGIDTPQDDKAAQRALWAKEWRMSGQELEKRVEDAQFGAYLDVWQYMNGLEKDKEEFRPVRMDAEWDERFVNALRHLADAREMAAEASMAVIGEKA